MIPSEGYRQTAVLECRRQQLYLVQPITDNKYVLLLLINILFLALGMFIDTSTIILVFIPALGTFLISDLLGGTDSQLIGNVIERQFKAANNWPLGAAMSFILLYVTFLALAVRAWLSGREARDV